LGLGVAVSRVVIYNRNDGDASHASSVSGRLSNSVVSLINYQGNTLKTYRIGDASNVPEFDISFSGINGVLITKAPTFKPTAFPTASPSKNVALVHKVRVQLEGTNYLHLREVQVYDTSGVNHALNKLATESSSPWGEIRSRWNSKCLEYDGNNQIVFMWECNGGSKQQWHLPSSKVDTRIEADGNRCLDAPGGAYSRVYWHWCHDGNNQKWTYDDMGRLHSVAYPHLCLDLYAHDNNNGAVVKLYQCNDAMNQKWLASTSLDASKAVNVNLNDWSHTNLETGNVP
jgi:hypothetical protein